jgi:hypothetical protein
MEQVTLTLTEDQLKFLQYISELEGLTIEEYLLKFANGQLVKLRSSDS